MNVRQPAPQTIQDNLQLPGKLPDLPDDLMERFPSLQQWEEDAGRWYARLAGSLQDANRTISVAQTKTTTDANNIVVSFGQFKAEVTTEIEAIVDTTGALARRLVTVSAMAGISSNITVSSTEPVGPSTGDYWIDTSDLTLPITYQFDGANWVEVTTQISFAGVADEREARVTADGYLSGKYTLSVIAGNVVTGMNITSSTGGGTDISSVIFRATDFQIYNGTSGVTMFSVSGSSVNLAGVLTVSTSGKIYSGAGTYGGGTTYFYVDNSNKFSLGSALTFDGSNLTVSGSITAAAGSIGGWTINSSTLSKNSTTLDSAGQIFLGTGNNIVWLSATDSTYRLWAGNATASLAAFSVTKGGILSASGANISGSISATSGTIGGWNINSSTISSNNAILDSAGQLVLGTANNIIYISATDATYRLWVGNASAGSAAFTVTKTGVMSCTGANISGTLTSSSGTIGNFTIGSTTLSSGSGASLVQMSSDYTVGYSIGSLTGFHFQLFNNGASFQSLSFWGTGGVPIGNIGSSTTSSSASFGNTSTFPTVSISGASTGSITLFGAVTAGSFSGSGASVTSLNATNISSGTLNNARLPSAISVTSLASTNFHANDASSGISGGSTAVDVQGTNLRIFSGSTQNARIDYTTGYYYVQNVQVVGTRNTGWTAQTATPSKADLGSSPLVTAIAQWASAVQAALTTHGLFGA